MRHRKQGRKLNRTGEGRRALFRGLVANLFTVEPKEGAPRRIRTTIPKAKEARRLAERLITLGKRGTLHARRRALALLPSKRIVKTLFEDIAPLYKDREGGYTRVLRLTQHRVNDGADLCYLELVSGPVEPAAEAAEPAAPRRVETPAGEEAAAPAAEAPATSEEATTQEEASEGPGEPST